MLFEAMGNPHNVSRQIKVFDGMRSSEQSAEGPRVGSGHKSADLALGGPSS